MSKINSAYQSGLEGVQRGLKSAAEHANQISKFDPESGDDKVEAMVGLKLDEHQVKASTKVIKAAERLDKSVLDILA